MADSRQLPSSKRTRLEGDGVEETDYSIPSGGAVVEALPSSKAEQLDHSHAKSKLKRTLMDHDGASTKPLLDGEATPSSTSSATSSRSAAVSRSISVSGDQMTYEDVQSVARHLLQRTKIRPEVGIICGSGLGELAEDLDKDNDTDVFPYKDIPNFPTTTVKGHKGNLVFGHISGHPVVCMQGRFHYYEGHPPWKLTMPVRVMKLLGVKIIIVTNAAGGLNPDYNMGDIMIMKDHINLAGMTGANPLIGDNEDRFGPRFPAMTTAYDRELRRFAKQAAFDLGMDSFIREGVYVHISGPNYETPSESIFLRNIGADAVGMSTAPEVTIARHADIKVLGMSLITNCVILEHDSDKVPPSHQEVIESGQMRALDMHRLVKGVIEKLAEASAKQSHQTNDKD